MKGKRMSPETGVSLSGGGGGLGSWGETRTAGDATTALGSLTDSEKFECEFSALWAPFSVGVDSSSFVAILRLGAGLGGTSSAAFRPIGGNLLNPSPSPKYQVSTRTKEVRRYIHTNNDLMSLH